MGVANIRLIWLNKRSLSVRKIATLEMFPPEKKTFLFKENVHFQIGKKLFSKCDNEEIGTCQPSKTCCQRSQKMIERDNHHVRS